jgi:small subunit ribosomal protein S16
MNFMLTIRFSRVGKKNQAQFRIVLQEHTANPKGRHVEVLGSWDPHRKVGVFKDEKIKSWIGKGAKLSDTVHNLLVKQGIIKDKKRAIKISKPKEATEQPAQGGSASGGKVEEKTEAEVKTEEKPKAEVKEEKKVEKEAEAQEKPEEEKKTKTETKVEKSTENKPEEKKDEEAKKE